MRQLSGPVGKPGLRDLCFGELFSLWRTSATRILASAVFRRFGVPSPDIEALRNR